MEVDHFAAGTGRAPGDLAGVFQSLAGQGGAHQLVDQYGEQGDVGHDGTFLRI